MDVITYPCQDYKGINMGFYHAITSGQKTDQSQELLTLCWSFYPVVPFTNMD